MFSIKFYKMFNSLILSCIRYWLSTEPILNHLDLYNSDTVLLNQVFLEIEYIKVQELSFLPEYFLITALFCLTLFFLFSSKFIYNYNQIHAKYRYETSFMFLLIFVLFCYLIAIVQQMSLSSLTLTSFNDTVHNDLLSAISKIIIGLTSLFYIIFINKFLKVQKLSGFEYYIILLISIFGFFLLCCVNDFISTYLAIELQGLAFYVLASFKKSSNFSVESGVKYFVLGSLSTALFLFGITMIYGLCGSIFFSDFKDFFVWFFAANSFFFAFDSLSFGFEGWQSNSDFTKLKTMYVDLESAIDIAKTFFESYCCLCSNSFLTFYDISKFTEFDFLQVTFFVSSMNDFLIERVHGTCSVDLLYTLKESSFNYKNFLDLKLYLFESSYYEDISLEKLSEVSSNTSVTTLLVGESTLETLHETLDYYSDYMFTTMEVFQNLESVEPRLEELPLVDKGFCNKTLKNSTINWCYMLSLAQNVNMNNFFSMSFKINSPSFMEIFDLDFLIIGFVLVIFALFFKLALAPFHLWSPDVYEGSPSSSTFFFMVLSKFGIFVLLFRLCYFSFYSLISYWQFYSLAIASVSILVGAVAGLKQRKLKSLLTYSSINNMGFVLLAFSSGGFEGVQVSFYYLIIYMLASICIWSIILNIQLKDLKTADKQNRDLGDLALLQESNSVAAQGLCIILFSLAGLPPMVGFLAKMSVFKVLSGFSLYYLSVINILFSIIATFYYLRLVKIIFFENFLIGNLYVPVNSKNLFIINLLIFLLVFFFLNPMFLYLYSYKITLFFNGSFY